MTLIVDQNLIHDAPLEDVLETILKLSGEDCSATKRRAVLDRKLEHLLMLAVEKRNHGGVPKDAPPPPISFDHLVRGLCETTAARDLMAGQPSKRKALSTVRATGTGISKLQQASARAAVMAFIAQHKAGVSMLALEDEFGATVRGHVQKLFAAGHVENVQ